MPKHALKITSIILFLATFLGGFFLYQFHLKMTKLQKASVVTAFENTNSFEATKHVTNDTDIKNNINDENDSGSSMSPLSNSREGAKLSQLYLDTAIAYAKIVDPASVAREGEVETAKKYAIPTGALTSNKATLEAITDMR